MIFSLLLTVDVEVGYEQTSYTITDLRQSVEMCVSSKLRGASASFSITIMTTVAGEFQTLLKKLGSSCVTIANTLQ